MTGGLLNNTDISELESFLLKEGKVQNLPYEQLNRFSQNDISVFCHKHAIYQLPTAELINFIQKHIGGESAIEIGSGNGCMGRSLGIPMTDNKMQSLPEIKAYYELMGQPVIRYGEDVEEIDAISAVKKYRPKVVVASWVTDKYREGMQVGNAMGIEEELLFENGVEKYIHIGNENVHEQKPILSMFPVRKFKHKTIISRSMSREKNIVYIFTKS